MSVILTHPTGNTFVRAALRAFSAERQLHSFYTTIAISRPVVRLLPSRFRRQAERRCFGEVPAASIQTRPLRESLRLLSVGLRSGRRPPSFASVDAVYADLDRFVSHRVSKLPARTPVTAVYAYEDGAEETFVAAKARGLACVYELPIAFWETSQRLLREEGDRRPEWRRTLGGTEDGQGKLERKSREINLADTVVVPSRFVFESLPETVRTSKHCIIASFGAPPVAVADAKVRTEGGRKLRVLFAGALTQRKGLADLFEAMTLLNRSDVELIVMGSLMAPLRFYRDQYSNFVYEKPRPHGDVLKLMRTCDVLALPSIVEGQALVQLEALASGLPLIGTHHGGGSDLIDEGRTGFLVPIRSPQAIAQRLAWFADHREMLVEMRQHAVQKAAQTTWASYQRRVLDAGVQSVRGSRRPEAAGVTC